MSHNQVLVSNFNFSVSLFSHSCPDISTAVQHADWRNTLYVQTPSCHTSPILLEAKAHLPSNFLLDNTCLCLAFWLILSALCQWWCFSNDIFVLLWHVIPKFWYDLLSYLWPGFLLDWTTEWDMWCFQQAFNYNHYQLLMYSINHGILENLANIHNQWQKHLFTNSRPASFQIFFLSSYSNSHANDRALTSWI